MTMDLGSLTEGLPPKNGQRNEILSINKIEGSTLELSTKVFFSLEKNQLKVCVEKFCYSYSTYGK